MSRTSGTAASHKPPISAHRAFPAIVALWFGALMGLGSLVLPAALFDSALAAAGVAFPVDFTTRLVISLVMGTLGAVLGFTLARRLATAQDRGVGRSFLAASPSQDGARITPISVRDDLDDRSVTLGGTETASRKRRSLAVTDEIARSEYLHHVPLPGAGDEDVVPDAAAECEAPQAASVEPAIVEADPVPTLAAVPQEPEQAVEAPPLDLIVEAEPVDEAPQVPEPEPEPEPLPRAMPPRLAALAANHLPAGEDEAGEWTGDDAAFDPLAQLRQAIALDRAEAAAAAETEASPATPSLKPDAPQMIAQDATQFTVPHSLQAESPTPRLPVTERALTDLSLVELVERFASALQQRSASHDVARGPVPAPAQEAAAHQPRPLPMPDALRPFTLDDLDAMDDPHFDALAPFSIRFDRQATVSDTPPTRIAALADVDADEDDADEETPDDIEAQGYSSLLEMRRPLQPEREFVRIEEALAEDAEDAANIPPVVVFPGQDTRRAQPAPDGPARDAAPPAAGSRRFDAPGFAADQPPVPDGACDITAPTRAKAEETERALREALMKLQRMSGAA